MSNLPSMPDDRRSARCILIVEDDATVGKLLREAIQDEVAMSVLLASSGEHALRLLQTREPALCLLDYHLPGINGLELAQRLCSQEGYEHLPILLMSADLPPGNTTGIQLRMLKKPFDLNVLLQLVLNLLAL